MKLKTICAAAGGFLAGCLLVASCSLDEYNPGGFTMETQASTIEGYETLINQCYFAVERTFYGNMDWMSLTESDTDLWTYKANKNTSSTQLFWYFAGAAPNTTYTNATWNSSYDGVGSCNLAISLASLPPYATPEERNAKVAEARFMRAIYYFNLVEQFGGVTKILTPPEAIDFHPTRTDPLEIYQEVIFPDLEFAFQWLPVGTYETTTRPTKKSALGFLAKTYLQATEYDAADKATYYANALRYAKLLIDDCQAGGGTYNAYMYPHFADVFADANNWGNKEALWQTRWYAGSDGHGSSNGNYRTNRNDELFYCDYSQIGALKNTASYQEYRILRGGNPVGTFMPTQHLLSLFVQPDGTLDPRYHASFQTQWTANQTWSWDKTTADKFDKDPSVIGTQLTKDADLALKFVMPQDADYAQEVAASHTSPYLLVDYKNIYNDEKKNIRMSYTYQVATSYEASENFFNNLYPSLIKHNSGNYYVANASKYRNGNLNGTFMMRMSEVYLIAAEADLYANGGAKALTYINQVRSRAGASPMTGEVTIRSILDERGRELCGEYCRFYDLKRTGMLKDNSYLQATAPDLAPYFKPEYALRPISTTYTAVLEGGGAYYQNPGY
ncbi:MAG: RagB/SusD family nutrient uptake outer membrane protein [Prevotellaceae bacterium]|jgi:hypothetical protein|nr:RagB/SusD family nutrient uptake outer membrane protein [Prevotellaceae bacterium]